jgi:hypothetical protein
MYQPVPTYPTYQPVPGQQAAYNYNGYLFSAPEAEVSPSPSDLQAAPGCGSCGGGSSCDSCAQYDPCGGCGRCSRCCLGEPWKLFGTTCSGITVGGWVSVGGYANAHGTPSNGILGFNNVGDGFTMPQLWGFMEKAVDTGGCGWDLGGRVDYVFGADGPDTQSFGGVGWDNDWDTSRDYGSAIPQLYVEVGYNDWTVKAGHFFTIIGAEVVQAPDNFFFSHAYSHIYGEPFTHTGALAAYHGRENWTFYGGWTAGWDTGFENPDGASTFLGGASYKACDNSTVTYALSAGDLGLGGGDIYLHSIVLETSLTQRLLWTIQSDLGVESGLANASDNYWGGVNQYLVYTLNECWALGMRFEWFYDRNGARVPAGRTGNYYNLTAGVNYRPHANVIFRPELRYDWFSGAFNPGSLPFDNGQDNEQFSGGFDFIFTF